MRSNRTKFRAGDLPSTVALVFVLGYLLTGILTLDETTRTVPLIAGAATLLLILVELVLSSRRQKSEKNDIDNGTGPAPSPLRELAAVLYVAGGVAGIILAGFIIAIPLYLFTSMAYLGNQSPRLALLVTLISSLTIYVVFEVMLSYQLYKGLLFS